MEHDDAALAALADEDLMILFAAGEARAARLLTDRLLPRILAHAARVLGNRAEAEDVAQEAMPRLWRAAADWRRDGARVSTWLFRVTANLCTDRLRRGGRGMALDAIAEPADDAPSVDDYLQQAARLAALDRARVTLPDRQRQAVVLRHLDGLSNPEIAAVLDVGIAAVESLTARGKRALTAALAPERGAVDHADD